MTNIHSRPNDDYIEPKIPSFTEKGIKQESKADEKTPPRVTNKIQDLIKRFENFTAPKTETQDLKNIQFSATPLKESTQENKDFPLSKEAIHETADKTDAVSKQSINSDDQLLAEVNKFEETMVAFEKELTENIEPFPEPASLNNHEIKEKEELEELLKSFEKEIITRTPEEFDALKELEQEIKSLEDMQVKPQQASKEDIKPTEKKVDKKGQVQEKKVLDDKASKPFYTFQNWLTKLSPDEPKLMKLMQRDGKQVELQQKSILSKFLNKFFKNFFKSGRSTETQRALGSILTKIQEAMRSGQTHYVDEHGKEHSLKDLHQNFLKTEYAKNILKNSPAVASKIATYHLAIISNNLRVQKSFNSLYDETSPFFKELNDTYINLITKKPYDGEAMLEFINNLPKNVTSSRVLQKSMEEMSKIELKSQSFIGKTDFKGVNLTKHGLRVLNETFQTEKAFLEDMKKLVGFYEDLLAKNLITEDEFLEMSNGLTDIIEGSNELVNKLAVLDTDLPEADKIKAYYEAFLPANIQGHYESFKIPVKNYENTLAKFTKLSEERPEINKQNEAFANRNAGLFPDSFIIKPLQRITKYPLLLADIQKHVMTPNEALETNVSYLKSFVTAFNASKIY